ncbi:hypothetical protein N6H13_15025 [Paenibacillus sp. CC-CFT742]|nr:glycoside hydrolase family 3 N-terminal domain-containing protein [Paenibacillus sp. CC-CFT742]WJH31707.1 hypothetical protein N6H13_15025 [Paenibacillus sp. CC-CFT742]
MTELLEQYQHKLARMTLREKIGQMLLCGFHGTEAAGDVERLLRTYPVGGVIYFARNIESPEQVERLSAGLQGIAAKSGQLPLWISIDQEGAWLRGSRMGLL